MRKVGKKRRGCLSNVHKASIAIFVLAISLMIWQIVHILQPSDADIATATLLGLQQSDTQQSDAINIDADIDTADIDTVVTTDKDTDKEIVDKDIQHEA